MSLVGCDLHDGVGVIELRRPERHNSLIPELLKDLQTAYAHLCREGAAAGVLAAAGPTFSTGGDMKPIREATDRAGYSKLLVGALNETILQMLAGSVPMVAAVHGMVTGGSLGLVLACDHVVVGEAVTFRPWYTTIGFAPDGGWTAILPEVIGRARTAAVLQTDMTISAVDAVAWGLAHEVVKGAEVRTRAEEVAIRIGAGKRGTRAAVGRLAGPDLKAIAGRLEAERQEFVRLVVAEEATEGMDAFLRGEVR